MSTRTSGASARQAPGIVWPPDAPDLRLGGLVLLDSSVHAVHPADESGKEDPTPSDVQRDWNIYAVDLAGGPPGATIGLIGELFISDHDWHLKVSALTPLEVRGQAESFRDSTDLDALASTWGPWANHVLWDFVAQHARILGSGVLHRFPLPQRTPEATYSVPEYIDEPDRPSSA